MQEETKAESANRCPTCGQPMEPVHFNADWSGLLVLYGDPPDGIVEKVLEPFTGSLVKTESGMPVLAGVKEKHRFPAMHCKHCRQIILRYSS
jgi:hypothetical protein